ncbi:MAG TPA: AbrB/MazE/SpoVT family DNA-binding domain-containing protein [Sphingomonas sp.]|jgi:AbrB family looped-hinge helix DNA binding protein|nr:AbrB/MazE/SpoVT family DNA-binding domain-containing protein [Sphingomonas sp.]
MNKLTNLTVKGQVTIPKDVRDALGLKPNEPVEIDWRGGDEAVIRKPKRDAAAQEAAYRAELERLEALAHKYRRLRTGQDTDSYMADLREPLPSPLSEDV